MIVITDNLTNQIFMRIVGETEYSVKGTSLFLTNTIVPLPHEDVDITVEVDPISAEDVDVERDRRIESGIEFEGHFYKSRQTDRENLLGAVQLASIAITAGAQEGDYFWENPEQAFVWLTEDNGAVPMDAQTVVRFGVHAARQKSNLIYKAHALKELEVIPQDYTDDSYWQ